MFGEILILQLNLKSLSNKGYYLLGYVCLCSTRELMTMIIVMNRPLTCTFTFSFDKNCTLTFSCNMNRTLTFSFDINCTLTFSFDINCTLTFPLSINRTLTFSFDINCTVTFSFDINLTPTFSVSRPITILSRFQVYFSMSYQVQNVLSLSSLLFQEANFAFSPSSLYVAFSYNCNTMHSHFLFQ